MTLLADSMVAVEITTAADGSSTDYTPVVSGKEIASIRYVKTDFADGVDFVITTEKDGREVLTDSNVNASETWYPTPVGNTPGTGAVLATLVPSVTVGHSRIKVVTAAGGDTKSGTIYFDLR